MQENFICPDDTVISAASCLAKCAMKERCLALPYLAEVAETREWTGVPSTTQLIQPTRNALLQIVSPYTINPRKQGYRMAGTRYHKWLDTITAKRKLNVFSEETLVRRTHTGRTDTVQEYLDGFELIDYKFWGSFRVAKAIGLTKEKIEQGGKPKTIYTVKPKNADIKELQLQLSDYACGWEEAGYHIIRAQAQLTIRDANTVSAATRGFAYGTDDTILIPVPLLDYKTINHYFSEKAKALLEALDNYKKDKSLPEVCNFEERWEDKRCAYYCDVAPFCPEGNSIKKEMRGD
jgi:hypothetical protein